MYLHIYICILDVKMLGITILYEECHGTRWQINYILADGIIKSFAILCEVCSKLYEYRETRYGKRKIDYIINLLITAIIS